MGKSIEDIKAESHHLRGHVYEDMFESGDSRVSEDSRQIMKFFGMYLQEDRDERHARKVQGLDPNFTFMVRIALFGGRLTAHQYLAIDALADEIGAGHFRLTSRQAIQIHGIAKDGLPHLVSRLQAIDTTTLAGCGDVERNVMCCSAPDAGGIRDQVAAIADRLACHLKPKTGAYLELFVNGQKVHDIQEEEPLYGETYLPRKFKTGFAIAGDNCTDVLSDDIGVVAHPDKHGNIARFTILAGGGLGHSHGVSKTRAILAKPLGSIRPDRLVEVVEAIITIQRDQGNREDRRFARMKYLVDSWGVDLFRAEVERRSGVIFEPAEALNFSAPTDHLGWHAVNEDQGYLGLFIPGGRVQKQGRLALQEIVKTFNPDLRVTAQQNLLLWGLSESASREVNEIWRGYGLKPAETMPPTLRVSMACVALPTCGLALAEAERVFPAVLEQVDRIWTKLGLSAEPLVVRMTGCPNNCVRSEMAEIGFVGSGPGKYHIYVGGGPQGTRLAAKFRERVPLAALVPTIEPLLTWYAQDHQRGQSFGDWVAQVGVESLQERLQEVTS